MLTLDPSFMRMYPPSVRLRFPFRCLFRESGCSAGILESGAGFYDHGVYFVFF